FALAGSEDADDVRVAETSRGASLAPETLELTLRRRRAKDLERDRAPERRVARFVDDFHAAGAERALDLVGTDLEAFDELERILRRRLRRVGSLERLGRRRR